MIKTALQVAFDEMDRMRNEPWFGKYKSPEEFEQACPDKALLLAELLNELIRRVSGIMKDVCDPVHQNPQDQKWWFWCEDWASAEGPFETEELCRAALAKYCEELERCLH